MQKLLTIVFLLFALGAKAQTLHFHQLTVKDGLPHNAVITLAQDGRGHIWVATFGGLCRYDGRQFTLLPDDDLPDKRVDRINRTQDGTMWVQCFEHHNQVSRYDTLTQRFVTYNVSDLSDTLRQQAVRPLNRTFADPRSSLVWNIEKRHLVQNDTLHPGTQLTYSGQMATDAGLKDELFYSLLLDRQGILWAGSASNGLFFADTHLSHYRRIVCQPMPVVRATFMDSQGTLWIAISDRQLYMRPGAAANISRVDYPMTDSVEGRRIRAFVEDSNGLLWMGTHDGVYVKDSPSAGFRRVDMAGGKTVAVYCLYNDDNKWLWMGADSGLYRLSLQASSPKAELVDSTVSFIGSIAADKNRLWVSSGSGLYCWADNKMTQWYSEATHRIITDATGQTWAGTDDGLIRITDHGPEHVRTAADGHTVKDLICWRDFLWCSLEQGLCCMNIYTLQSTTLHTEHNEYLDGSVCIDARSGTLYFGGTLGIDCLSADSLDTKLRSGTLQLWLEGQDEVIGERSEQPSSPLWIIIVLLMAIVCGVPVYTYFFGKRHVPTPADATGQSAPKTLSPFIQKATAVAEAHIADADFTAEQMAQEMAMSRTKLFLLMKNETGKAVMEFVRDIRLDFAASQLKKGVPVSEIYMACGFSDPSSFRRSFVKKYGINPSQYRQSAKSK